MRTLFAVLVLAGCGVGSSGPAVGGGRDRAPGQVPVFVHEEGTPDAGCGAANPYYDAGTIWAPPAECPNALQSDLPSASGLLFESMVGQCPASAPTGGTACSNEGLDCTFGSGQPGCFNRDWQCVNHQWVDVIHTDPTAPFNAGSCQIATLPAGCPTPYDAFFTRNGTTCSVPAGTSCDYGHGGGARCVEFSLSCDGVAWNRTPREAWAYCACTR